MKDWYSKWEEENDDRLEELGRSYQEAREREAKEKAEQEAESKASKDTEQE